MGENTFSKYGEVTDVYNTGKGFAFVTMADQSGVEAAIDNLHGTEIDGREVKVEQAKPREEGRGGGFGGRGGGGYGGRGGGGYGEEMVVMVEEMVVMVEEMVVMVEDGG